MEIQKHLQSNVMVNRENTKADLYLSDSTQDHVVLHMFGGGGGLH